MTNATSRDATSQRHGAGAILGWAIAVLVVMVVAGGLVYARQRELRLQTSQLKASFQQGVPVLVQPASAAPTSGTLDLPATIHGYVETPVYAKIPGYLKSIQVDKGDHVTEGEPIAVLESPETDKEVADARANYWLQLVTDRRDRQLVSQGVIAQQTTDNQHALMLQAKAALQQFLAMQAYEVITAPVSGLITARYADPGTLIPQATAPATATPIVAITTIHPVRVYAFVPQDVSPLIKNGDPAQLTVPSYPGHIFEGSITRHPTALDANNLTMLIEMDLLNRSAELYPGMYGRLHLRIASHAATATVPDDALVFRNDRVYVPVVHSGRLHLAPVTLGNDTGYTVQVTQGLKPGQLVAVNVGGAAREGERVHAITPKTTRPTNPNGVAY
jgi:membrane fusion protein (multidrug efflux system)